MFNNQEQFKSKARFRKAFRQETLREVIDVK